MSWNAGPNREYPVPAVAHTYKALGAPWILQGSSGISRRNATG
jgi:hypothetical protein